MTETLPRVTGNLETCPSCGWVSLASSRRERCKFCGGPRRPRWAASPVSHPCLRPGCGHCRDLHTEEGGFAPASYPTLSPTVIEVPSRCHSEEYDGTPCACPGFVGASA